MTRANVVNHPRARGFTLIEVLAALVIVALGMMGVIEAVTQSARNGTYLREKTLAHWIAMNVVTERRLQASAPNVGETSDDVEFAGMRWHWKMVVTQTQVESMRRMDVTVRGADSPEDTSLANVSGYYGSAIGATGGSMSWAGAGGTGPGGVDGADGADGAENPGTGRPTPTFSPRPPPADDEE